MTYKDYFNRINRTHRLWFLFFSVPVIVGSYWVPELSIFWFIPVFTFFDVIGFQTLITWNEGWIKGLVFPKELPKDFYDFVKLYNPDNGDPKDQHMRDMLGSYRILQGMFHVAILGFIWQTFGWEYAVSSELLHLFGVEDVLYYWVVKMELPTMADWLSWTIFGWFKSPLNKQEIITQSIVGFILTGLFLIGKNIYENTRTSTRNI